MGFARFVNVILSFVGLRLVRVHSNTNHRAKNAKTGANDVTLPTYAVDCVIDVGVGAGTPWLYDQFEKQPFILVEPLNVFPELAETLEGREFEMYECAAGSVASDITINFDITRPALSSIFERTELTKRPGNVIEQRTVPVKTIDQIVSETRFSAEEFGLKIDTEGYELEALKGATKTLKKCKFVVCEASIEKRFEGSYNLSELVLFMGQHNFHLVKVLRFAVDKNKVIRMADVLFEPIS